MSVDHRRRILRYIRIVAARSCPAIALGARTSGARGAVAPPTELLEEQLVHPAPPIFSVTYS